MTAEALRQIFNDTDFVHTSGTPQELQVAEYLRAQCEALGVRAWLEPFPVDMTELQEAHVLADGEEIPCVGFGFCAEGPVEGELYYMPGKDPVSMAGARDKIVLLDGSGIRYFPYQDLMKAGAKGLLFQYGNVRYPERDIDQRELRSYVVGEARRVPAAMIHTASAVELLRRGTKRVSISVRQRVYRGESRNVVAELPGKRDEWIVLTAHYDSTALSHGSYDNMSGSVGILGVLEALRNTELNYGLRLVFCGSEERGLLGSKAYTQAHREELDKIALNVNLDMVGSWLGKFIACASAEERLAGYISYMGAELGFPVSTRQGVYSSDSTPFADQGVPAVSFARLATKDFAPIHCRYDRPDLLSMEQMGKDIGFIAEFTRRMACAAHCPVRREIPDKVRTELDEYLNRRRKNNE